MKNWVAEGIASDVNDFTHIATNGSNCTYSLINLFIHADYKKVSDIFSHSPLFTK